MSKQPSSRPECAKETDNSDDANYDENPLKWPNSNEEC